MLTQDIIFENSYGDDGKEASGTEKDNGLCYYDDDEDKGSHPVPIVQFF